MYRCYKLASRLRSAGARNLPRSNRVLDGRDQTPICFASSQGRSARASGDKLSVWLKSISTLHAANSTKFTGWWQKHEVTSDEWVDYDDLEEDGNDEDDFVVGDQEEFEDDDDDDEEEDQHEEEEEEKEEEKHEEEEVDEDEDEDNESDRAADRHKFFI